MAYRLQQIVPWGRSLDEYVQMFALSERDLNKRILGCADGPASFNAALTRRGGRVVSVDPLYVFGEQDIRQRIDRTFDEVLRQAQENRHEFLWETIRSVEQLGEVRMTAMDDFLADYPQGRRQGRYLPMSAPALALADDSFELALCSHFLFLYSKHLNLDFHIDTIGELCRIGSEVRIFPLQQLGATLSPHVAPVTAHFEAAGYSVTRVAVPYRFQRGADTMLRIVRGKA
jgi:hypothetical protein